MLASVDFWAHVWLYTVLEAMEPVTQQQYTPGVQQPSPAMNPQPNVGFPAAKSQNGSKTKWIVLIIVIVSVILGVGGWLLMKGGSSDVEPSPTPESGVLSSFATPVPDPTAEPTEEPSTEPAVKSEVKIEILNGTGTPGDASLVKTALTKLGYENVEAANSDTQEEERTTVTFARELPTATIDEITAALEGIFAEVRVRKGSLSDGVSVRILTGPKTGTTSPTPAASATPTASPEVTE